MTKVILIGTPQCQWSIGGHMIAGGTTLDLSDSDIKKHKDVIQEVVKEVKEKPKKEVIEPVPDNAEPHPKESKPKYTKEGLTDIAVKKGIAGLRKIGNKLNIKFRSIPEGIREILEAQK